MKIFTLLCCTFFYLQSAFSQLSDSSDFFYQKGKDDKSKRLYMVAFNDFHKSLQYKPDHIDAERELGLVAVELRRFEEAKLAFLQVNKWKKDDSTAIENLAILYFWTHQWPDAITYALKARDMHVGKNWNYILGKSYYEQEDYGQAFKWLQAAAQEDSLDAEIPYLTARAFVEMNNYKPAIAYFKRAIALDSSKVEWIYECALTLATIYDDKSAIKYYELAALRGYKKDNDFYENLSDSYIAAGEPQKGLELMLHVLEKKPADLDLLYTIANTYYRMKRYQDAIDYWDRVLSYDKGNAKALYMIGMSYQKKGDEKKGQELCDKAIEMDPSLKNLKTEKKINM